MTDYEELDAKIGIQTDFAKTETDEANAKAKEEFDNVNHPLHYVSHPSGVETINITREFEFALGNAWKYLMRFRYKGEPKEDLEKAVWYMNDYMNHRDLYTEFTVKLGNEKTENLINNARKVIAAEKIPEVKHAMRAILEQALFGRNVVCDFIEAKVELELQVEQIATSLYRVDEFDADVAFAKTMIAADKLLQRIDKIDKADRKRAEEFEKEMHKVDSDKAETWFKNDIPEEIDVEHCVQVYVDDKTHEVFGVWTDVNLADHVPGHTEIVAIPVGMSDEAAKNYALEIVRRRYENMDKSYADETPNEVPAETPTEILDEKPKKRRRRKKTEK